MISRLLLIFIALTASASAQEASTAVAQVERIADGGALTLLGRGLRMVNPEASLTLVCTGAHADNSELRGCDQLRWALFMNAEEAYFLGESFSMRASDGTLDQKLLQTKLKSLHQAARRSSRNVLKSAAIVTGSLVALAVIVATAGAPAGGAAGGALLSPGLAGGLAATWGFLLLTDLYSYASTPRLLFMPNQTRQVHSQTGWNWADDPKRVPPRYFQSLFRMIARQSRPRNESQQKIDELMVRLHATPRFPLQPGYQ